MCDAKTFFNSQIQVRQVQTVRFSRELIPLGDGNALVPSNNLGFSREQI